MKPVNVCYIIVANCRSVQELIDDSVVVTETYTYTAPFIGEGSTARFTCSAGLELVGSETTTCIESGEWRPDPREVECRG